MKRTKGFLALATIIGMVVVSGCTTNDVYDPDKAPETNPTNNPLGEGFSAPGNFSWSMVNTVNLNVEVKDELSGQYDYLIEVFTTNPLSNASAKPIAAGVAQQSTNYTYTAEVNVPKTVERLYIRQTDPKQRKEVYEYAVPANGGTLNCKLYYTGSPSTKALSTRSVEGGTSGWNDIQDPGYTEQTYDVSGVTSINEEGVVNSSNQLSPGTVCIIKSSQTFDKDIDSYNGANATVYVQGTWNIPNGAMIQGIDIIVLNGGKITSGTNGFQVADKSSLTIQSGGEVDCGYFHTATNVLIKNFGTFHSTGIKSQYGTLGFNTGTVLYNAKNAVFRVDDSFYITSSTIYNHGTIEITNESEGLLQTNNDLSCVIANYAEASIKVHAFKGGATVVNNGFIEVDICENSSTDALYNNCTFIVKESFKFRNVVLDKGSITGGRASSTSQEWLPVPYVESQTDSKFTLVDGSMIKAIDFVVLSGNVEFQATNSANTDKSMIKAKNMYFNWNTQVNGNLVLEEENEYYGTPGNLFNNSNCVTKASTVVSTGYDESKYTIETCGGYFDEGNGGGTPGNPTFPITIGDATNYTYAFEDLWPVYGDFDLNDIVLTLKNKSAETNGNGSLRSEQFQISLDAVGASKMLGVGIRFLGLSATPKSASVNGNSVSFENGQTQPTFILFNDAHAEFGFTDSRPFINTQKDASTNRASKTYDVVLTFDNNSVNASAFNINNLDVFIITKAATASRKRTEVHIAGYAPTDLADISMLKTGNDDSSAGHYYLSTENLAWGIVLPTNFAWPLETNKVSTVYGQFESWVTSGGTQDGEWYNTHNDNVYANQ